MCRANSSGTVAVGISASGSSVIAALEGVTVAGQLYWSDIAFGAAGAGTVSEANLDRSGRHIIVTGQDVPQMMAVTPAGP